jgi:hypothetical protein
MTEDHCEFNFSMTYVQNIFHFIKYLIQDISINACKSSYKMVI